MCFCVSRLDALFLKSTVSFPFIALRFFIFFTLKHGKFRFQRWNRSYRASKSRGNTATEGWKRTGTFPLTFTFADKHIGCYGNGLIEFGACSIWIVEDVGRGSFLFPTYLGRSKETLFAGQLSMEIKPKRYPSGEKLSFFPTQIKWMNCHISFIQKRFDEEHDPSEFFLLLATETDIVL